jgi:hypothetical protein
MKSDTETLQDLVRAKIENLRPKLLDLSRRNPLIATKLGPRSNSHIRAVDELPDVLYFKLNNNQEMQLIPLPTIEDDPRDELTDEFREALINARLTDEIYLVLGLGTIHSQFLSSSGLASLRTVNRRGVPTPIGVLTNREGFVALRRRRGSQSIPIER